MKAETLDIGSAIDGVPVARRFTVRVLSGVDPAIAEAAELAVSELVTNALLHAGPPVVVRVADLGDGDVRLEVHDSGRTLPVRPLADGGGMTGRGLALVDALASRWGVEPLPGGKVVWAELSARSVAEAQPGELDSEQLLAAYADWPEDPTRRLFRISLGDVPTDLLLDAKAHVDSVIRELVLSAGGAASGQTAALPGHLVDLINGVVTEFADARQEIKRQALAAAERGDARTTLELSLPLEAADAGERYLQALVEADSYARAARLLTLAAPAQHQAFRRWYVTSLVAALRSAAAGETATVQTSFETHLLRQVDELAELQRVSERAARLQRVTASLAAALTVEAVAQIVLEDALAELQADRGAFMFPVEGRLRAVAVIGYDAQAVANLERRWADGVPTPVLHAYRTGEGVWVETMDERDARFPSLASNEPGVVATCAVPMLVAEHTVGVFRVSFLESRLFTDDERSFAEALGSVASQALERVSLYDEKARTADRLTRLQSVSAALARTRSLDSALNVAIEHATGLMGAQMSSVSLLDPDDQHTIRLVRVHPPHAATTRFATYDLSDELPAAEAIRTGEIVSSASVSERDARWPALSVVHWDLDHALFVLPLTAEDTPVGALTLSFRTGGTYEPPDEAFLMAFADACAQALERARASERAALAHRRLRVLAQASAQLGASLDVERTLASVARLCVHEIADWCAIHLLVGGELTAVAAEHVDPHKRDLAVAAQARWPARLADPGGVGEVVRSGVPVLIPDLAEVEPGQMMERDPEHTALVRELGLGSVIIVPLLARGRTVGALTLVAAESGIRYAHGDLAFAQELASRAAVAIDNANLFSDTTSLAVRRLNAGSPGEGDEGGRWTVAPAHVGRFSINVADEMVEADGVVAAVYGLPAQAITRPLSFFLDRVHPDDVELIRQGIAHAVTQRADYSIEHRIVQADGPDRWLVIRGRSVLGPDGSPTAVTGIAYEPLRRQEDNEVARLLETMIDAFVRLDREWRFTYVNSQAERLLFRSRTELLGKVIWDEFPESVDSQYPQMYAEAMETGRAVAFEEFFVPLDAWFEVRAMPDAEGLSVFFHDVSVRKRSEDARARAGERLALLGEATRGLVGTLEITAVLRQITAVVVPRFADWAIVTLLDATGVVEASHALHADEAHAGDMTRLLELHGDALLGSPAFSPVLQAGETLIWPTVSPLQMQEAVGQGELGDLLVALGVSSVLVVPLQSGAATLGVLCLFKGPGATPFTSEDQGTAADIGRRAGLALDNARLYERQRTASEVLQRSLLTPLPEPDHLQIAARYLPAAQEAQVGGDWYDAFLQPDGATVLAIGDVVGHDMNAAAAMGQLRNLLRGIAYDSQDSPANVLTRVDCAIRGLQIDTLATAVVARIEQTPEQRSRLERTLRWSNAGHPPPFLVRTSGIVSVLDTNDGMLLGLDPQSERHDHVVTLLPGDTLVFFTDGLVERRDSPIEEGLARLADTLGEVHELPLEDLLSRLVAALLPANADDDVAIVALRAFREDKPRPPEAGPENVPVDVPPHP